MINIINSSTDPYFNLAVEEYFMKHKDINEDVLMLWQNEPTIVVGRNQNTFEELNMEYVAEKHIKVVRRMSGGGAVYHDLGNLNYTIIKNDGQSYKNDFSFFALPVISCLDKLGVSAEFNGRNDILIDGKKFSGNAQYFYKDKVLHHGTLLFSSDLTVLGKALQAKQEKLESKGIKSVKSRVINIGEKMNGNLSIAVFRETLINSFFEKDEESKQNYILTDEDIRAINEIRNSKYSTWNWNYGQSPKMSYHKELRFPAGSISLKMNINDGNISECRIYGDFFEVKPIDELEKQFVNTRFDKSELDALLLGIEIGQYIHLLSNKEFGELLYY